MLTQTQLAAAVRLSLRQLQRYESGEARPRPAHLAAIAASLGVAIAQFFIDAIRDAGAGNMRREAKTEENIVGGGTMLPTNQRQHPPPEVKA